MTSPAQIAANRRNAALSTGPRSQRGTERSARNALRHGLTSAAVRTAIPTVARQTALAAAFRADLPESEGVLDAAWAAAEATHTLELLRAHRRSLLSVPLVGSPAPDRNVPAGDVKAGAAEDTDLDPAIREASLTLFSAACLRHRTALARLETYERRALSRRRRAIQALAYYTITAEAPQRAPRE